MTGIGNYAAAETVTKTFVISKAAQEAPEDIVATDETVSGKNDGTIRGLEPGMEYSDDGGETWTPITEDMLENGALTGLEPGDYQIRNAGDDNHAPSAPVEVTIEAGRKLTVTFNSNEGSEVAAQSVDYNGTATKPEDPTKEGFIFGGWDSDEDLTEAYNFSTKVTADITLYAKWNEVAPEGYHIIIEDYTKGKATTSVEAEQLYSGETTFTVTCDMACVLAIDNGDDTYTRLVCTTADDTHSFTVTVTDADVHLVMVIKGDVSLDGNINSKDITVLTRVSGGVATINAVQMLAADLNPTPDGVINSKDITVLTRASGGVYVIPW